MTAFIFLQALFVSSVYVIKSMLNLIYHTNFNPNQIRNSVYKEFFHLYVHPFALTS